MDAIIPLLGLGDDSEAFNAATSRVRRLWELMAAVMAALKSKGVDVIQADRAFDQVHGLRPEAAFLRSDVLAQRIARFLVELSGALDRKTESSRDRVQIGNLVFPRRPQKSFRMPQLGLRVELVALLNEMTSGQPGWRPVSHVRNLINRTGEPNYEVAAAFARCALGGQQSADSVRKAVTDLVKRYPDLILTDWP